MKLHSPAADRNKQAIVQAMVPRLPATGTVLEISSGSGQHGVYFAEACPQLDWQPSDVDPDAVKSIDAYARDAGLSNLKPALQIDVAREAWARDVEVRPSAAFNANMIHIAPWECCRGLFRGLAELLPASAPLLLYGPFRFGGELAAPSNVAFDASLRQRDARFGIRDIADVDAVARAAGFENTEQIEMPANNHLMVFVRRA